MKFIQSAALICHLWQPIFNTKQTTRIIGFFYTFQRFTYSEAPMTKSIFHPACTTIFKKYFAIIQIFDILIGLANSHTKLTQSICINKSAVFKAETQLYFN